MPHTAIPRDNFPSIGPHDDFLGDHIPLSRPPFRRSGDTGPHGPGSTTARLARLKRLTFRRFGAEGRIETLFPSLLSLPVPHNITDEEHPADLPPDQLELGAFNKTPTFKSGLTTQAKAARRAKSKRRKLDESGADPFSFLSTTSISATSSSSTSGAGGSTGTLGSGGGGFGIRPPPVGGQLR